MKDNDRNHLGSSPAPPSPGERKILESWKEIASHLNRNIRTCQMWEREMGLPIHRLDGSPKARVFAYRDELDSWLDEKLSEGRSEEKSVRRPFFFRGPRIAVFAGFLAIAAVGTTTWLVILRPHPADRRAQNPSAVAVLPFQDLSPGKDHEYLGDGIAAALMVELAGGDRFRVAGRTSAFRVGDRPESESRGRPSLVCFASGFAKALRSGRP
jgi:hypothetical protein